MLKIYEFRNNHMKRIITRTSHKIAHASFTWKTQLGKTTRPSRALNYITTKGNEHRTYELTCRLTQ